MALNALLVLSLAQLATAGAVTLTLTHSLVKVRPLMPTPVAITQLHSAKNEMESCQVVVRAGSADATVSGIAVSGAGAGVVVTVHREHMLNVTTVSDCDGALGEWPDALVPDVDEFVGEKRNAFPLVVQKGRQQAFWVDVFVPADAKAGMQQLKVAVTTSAEGTQTLPLELEVWDFALPSTSTRYVTTYNCHSKNILSGKYLEKVPKANATEEVTLQQQFVELGLRHRVTFSDFLGADEAPLAAEPPLWDVIQQRWGAYLDGIDLKGSFKQAKLTAVALPPKYFGERTYSNSSKERAEIDQMWHATGCPRATPEWGYAYWGEQLDGGASDMMTYCKHALNCGASVGCDKWAKGCATTPIAKCTEQKPGPRPPLNNSRAIAYWRSALAHARSAGWADRMFDYTCDEPGNDPDRIATCKTHGSVLHEADPSLRSLITAENVFAKEHNMSEAIDIWVPILNFLDDGNNASGEPVCPHYDHRLFTKDDKMAQRKLYDPYVAANKSLWWYISCMSQGCSGVKRSGCPGPELSCTNGTWPSYMIDAPSPFNRAMSWMSFVYDVHGELYWGSNAADGVYTKSDTNSSWENQWLAGGNGDGSLTYPGRVSKIGGETFIPIASIRLKHIRDGLEDLEYMYMLEELTGSRAAALDIISPDVVRRAYDFEHADGAKMLAARKKMGALIHALSA